MHYLLFCVELGTFQQMFRAALWALKGSFAWTITGITITSLNRSDIDELNGAASVYRDNQEWWIEMKETKIYVQ